jgi:hypothetical protein
VMNTSHGSGWVIEISEKIGKKTMSNHPDIDATTSSASS